MRHPESQNENGGAIGLAYDRQQISKYRFVRVVLYQTIVSLVCYIYTYRYLATNISNISKFVMFCIKPTICFSFHTHSWIQTDTKIVAMQLVQKGRIGGTQLVQKGRIGGTCIGHGATERLKSDVAERSVVLVIPKNNRFPH